MIKPYYEDSSCTIYLGDALEVVPQLQGGSPYFDLILTDPPYGIGEAAGNNKTRGKPTQGSKALIESKDYGDLDWDNERLPKEYIDLMLNLNNRMVMFGGNYYSDLLPVNNCWIIWDKVNYGSDFADCEIAWTNLPGAIRKIEWQWNGFMQQVKETRYHPTQKPLGMIKQCIRLADKYSPIGRTELILDPFMGSGTTLRAAKDLGRKAIGIDKHEPYCEIVVNRLRQEVLPL